MIRRLLDAVRGINSFLNSVHEYREIFKYTGIVATRKFKKAKKQHKYAIMIAARNEEAVIGNLIDSIRKQDYPRELIDVFVVADNCTDNTARTVREMGEHCYERFDTEHRTKGFALQYLVECIRRDFGIERYDAYLIFDADNLLKSDYMTRMNESFDAGEKIVTSYRNTKNFDDNWISASYAIHWLRTIRNEHRARSLFRLATRIQGTGFLFANEIIKDGWNYTSLTEDRAFCADAVANGYKISYNNDAIFYDEQPVDMKIAMRQRIRWAKGHLQAFAETGPKLFYHIFFTRGMANKTVDSNEKKKNVFIRLFNNIRFRFMSFDMLTVVFPRGLWTSFKKIAEWALRVGLIFTVGEYFTVGYAPEFLQRIVNLFGYAPEYGNNFDNLFWLSLFTLGWTVYSYCSGMMTAVYVFIIEHRRIAPMKWYRKIWFCITFPMFDMIGRLATIIALFTKVEWKPIPHNVSKNISELR